MKPRDIEFKPLTENDLTLLHDWFHKPHIKQWYARNDDYTQEMVNEKYLPRVRQPELIPNFIINVDKQPIGYIQLYRVSYSLPDGVSNDDHPLFANFKSQDMAGIDMFIAEEAYLSKGYATLVLQNFIKEYVKGKFSVLVADPHKTNRHAIHFFERNGFEKLQGNQSSSDHELLVFHAI
jgi:aminoglycoside 6'-N-acetyltransferase